MYNLGTRKFRLVGGVTGQARFSGRYTENLAGHQAWGQVGQGQGHSPEGDMKAKTRLKQKKPCIWLARNSEILLPWNSLQMRRMSSVATFPNVQKGSRSV